MKCTCRASYHIKRLITEVIKTTKKQRHAYHRRKRSAKPGWSCLHFTVRQNAFGKEILFTQLWINNR